MTERLRIRTKIGDAEFDAEGPAEIVQRQLDLFWSAVRGEPEKREDRSPKKADDPLPQFEDEKSKRIFSVEHGGVVALRHPLLDSTPSEVAVLLLYGYQNAGFPTVKSSALLKSMRLAGINYDRVDRLFDEAVGMVESEGQRRGKRYRLTEDGLHRAEQLAERVLAAP